MPGGDLMWYIIFGLLLVAAVALWILVRRRREEDQINEAE
jgi:LPXTG-motif cell wall-anchored protein